jgi:5-methylcytosine-specific restriction endonuclease McrA
MTGKWHADRFVEDARKLRYDCVNCGRGMWFPASKHGKYKTCGSECANESREKARSKRARQCLTCGTTFTPRPRQLALGQGKFCCIGCNDLGRQAGNTPEARQRAYERRQQSIAEGTVKFPAGPEHHSWKGGKEASTERARPKVAARTREYRKRHPEMMREAKAKRRGIGRLPRGTVKRIGEAQRWKCAVCRCDIHDGYHMDHIMPLARGGEHAPNNLQLLCGPCNLRKSAKHPVDFMQSRGFLL